jgi:cysteine desulfurase/selenocysteine lyase
MSEVYLLTRPVPGSPDRVELVADSDAHIVRGEIALLQKLFSGQRAAEVLKFDVDAFFNRIGLEHFLSAQRRNGLASMVQRIRAAAAAIEKGGDARAG